MGYYTYVNMEINEGGPTLEQVAETVGDVTKDTDINYWVGALQGENEVQVVRARIRHAEGLAPSPPRRYSP